MKIKNIAFVFLLLVSIKGFAVKFADQKFYLIDSLDKEKLSSDEIVFLDSTLTVYHKEKNDSIKLTIINTIIESINDISIWPRYNTFLLKELNKQFGLKDKRVGLKYLKQLQAGVYNNIGYFHNENGRIKECLDYYNKALKLREEINEPEEIGSSLNNLGYIYKYQKDYDNALNYYNKALKIFKKSNNEVMIGYVLNNIASIYKDQENYVVAKSMFLESFRIHKKVGNERGICTDLANLGGILWKENNVDSALIVLLQSHELAIKANDKVNILLSAIPIANIYYSKHLFSKVDSMLTIHLPKSIELNSPGILWQINLIAYKSEKRKGNLAKALLYYENYVQLKDTILNINTKADAVKQSLKFEFEKQKAIDDASHKKQIELDKKTKEKQRLIIYTVIGGIILIFSFSIILFNRLKLTIRQKKVITLQKKQVDKAFFQLEEKNKEITDSINYAERIQRSFIATKSLLDENLNEYFVFFKPKDIVSGDFYWAAKLHNDQFALVTADSTGHGVPGAIMSLLNVTSLEKAIESYIRPADILNSTRKTIIERLKKDGSLEGGKDGMDASLCVYDFKNKKLTIAAANNPVWIVRRKVAEALEATGYEVIEVKPDKMPIGKHDKDSISFTQQEFDLQSGDVIYTLTDGFPDQFGGPNGKKFMSKNLRELLTANAHLPMKEQKQLLEQTFANWVGNMEQVDDVTLIGVKV